MIVAILLVVVLTALDLLSRDSVVRSVWAEMFPPPNRVQAAQQRIPTTHR